MDDIKIFPPQDPEAELDYLFDWASKTNNNGKTDWLKSNEVITNYTISIEPPDEMLFFNDSLINGDSSVYLKLKDGTVNTKYIIKCSIETNQARKDVRRASVLIKQR